MWYSDLKTTIELYSGLEKDALHIHAALFIYILALALFRQSRRSRFPWLLVLGVELINEAMDLKDQYLFVEGVTIWDAIEGGWPEAAKDLWNTMLWPTVLLFIGRYTDLFAFHRPSTISADPASEGVSQPESGEGACHS